MSLIGIGVWSYLIQLDQGFIATNLSDQVNWGAYIANFTYMVGVSDAAILLLIPTFLYKKKNMDEVALFGLLLSVCAVIMSLGFVVVDIGRPDRFWHLFPGLGRLNFPVSMLAWDVVFLNIYLMLALHIPGYWLFSRYRGRQPTPIFFMPFIYLNIVWAVCTHTVTAFLYAGIESRPYWNSAILAPRFLVSSFACGSAILLLMLTWVDNIFQRNYRVIIQDFLISMLKYTVIINLFLFGAEAFKEFYSNSVHVASIQYLLFGLHGKNMLQPYIWSAIFLEITALVILLTPRLVTKTPLLIFACLSVALGIWIEKGMGLVVPGFIPTPLGDIREYTPSSVEIGVSLGLVGVGALLFTVFSNVANGILSGKLSDIPPPPRRNP